MSTNKSTARVVLSKEEKDLGRNVVASFRLNEKCAEGRVSRGLAASLKKLEQLIDQAPES
jgi:hypothetical protein